MTKTKKMNITINMSGNRGKKKICCCLFCILFVVLMIVVAISQLLL